MMISKLHTTLAVKDLGHVAKSLPISLVASTLLIEPRATSVNQTRNDSIAMHFKNKYFQVKENMGIPGELTQRYCTQVETPTSDRVLQDLNGNSPQPSCSRQVRRKLYCRFNGEN